MATSGGWACEAAGEAHHSHRICCRDDAAKEEGLVPSPVVWKDVAVDDGDEACVDGDAREGEGKDLGRVAEEGVPIERRARAIEQDGQEDEQEEVWAHVLQAERVVSLMGEHTKLCLGA